MKKIGIFAGTFDPIHEGHLAFAKTCLKELELDTVIFLPEPTPRYKQNVSPVSERIETIREAIHHDPNLSVEFLPSATFTIKETLPILENKYVAARLTFLFGSDIALHIASWPDLEHLLKRADIAIGLRSQHSKKQVIDALKDIPTYTMHSTNASHISSSQLRN